MNIVELIAKVGSDRIKVQSLDSAATNMDSSGKGKLTTVTFLTDQPLTLNGSRDMGIVLWLPRDRVSEIIDT